MARTVSYDQRVTYYLNPDPATWGESCPNSIAEQANVILADMVEGHFHEVRVVIANGRNIWPGLGMVDDWIAENYLTALEQAKGGKHEAEATPLPLPRVRV